jgi:hypothetical protein
MSRICKQVVEFHIHGVNPTKRTCKKNILLIDACTKKGKLWHEDFNYLGDDNWMNGWH